MYQLEGSILGYTGWTSITGPFLDSRVYYDALCMFESTVFIRVSDLVMVAGTQANNTTWTMDFSLPAVMAAEYVLDATATNTVNRPLSINPSLYTQDVLHVGIMIHTTISVLTSSTFRLSFTTNPNPGYSFIWNNNSVGYNPYYPSFNFITALPIVT